MTRRIAAAFCIVLVGACGDADRGVKTESDGVRGVTMTHTTYDGVDCMVAKTKEGVGVSCDWGER